MTNHDQVSDSGPDGEAFAVRPYAISQVGAVSRGSVAPGRVIEAKRMVDTCLIDRMHNCAQLSDRQHQAAKNLLRMKHSGGLSAQVSARYAYVHDHVEDEPDDGERDLSAIPIVLDADETWRDRLNRIMRAMGDKQAELLWHLLDDRHPGLLWLATVQASLTRLADDWGFEK